MRTMAVIHPRHLEWVEALRQAEPRIDFQGAHPKAWATALEPAFLAQAEGLFCWKLPEGLTAAMPRLAWVQNSGAGVDHLVAHPELPATIPITRADGQFGLWMARYVVGHLLGRALRMEDCAEAQRRSEWAPKLLPEDLTGARAVVLGFGRIGRQVARALRELGLEVTGLAATPRLEDGFEVRRLEDGPTLLEEARALVLCAPLTPLTREAVNGAFLARARHLTLINVGRGELLDLEALRDALGTGRVAEAILDVFPEEPLPADHWLWSHPGVTVTPHHSGPSRPYQLVPDILDNLRRFAEGRAIEGAVDRARGY
jgi:glyoxylate/hydroxypyruvate reductase A